MTTLGPKQPFAYDQSIHEHCVPKWQGFRLWPRTAVFSVVSYAGTVTLEMHAVSLLLVLSPFLYKWAFCSGLFMRQR